MRRLEVEGETARVALEAIKDQIRYQKQILGLKGNVRLSGTLEELSTMLKEHLQPAEDGQVHRDSESDDESLDENDPPAEKHQHLDPPILDIYPLN